MRSAWLVLAVLTVVAGNARADEVGSLHVGPEHGAAVAGSAHARPARPVVTNLTVELQPGRGNPVAVHELSFHSETSPDTVTLEITIEDAYGTHTITTTPDDTYLYPRDLRLARANLDVAVVAIDAAGNRSDPERWHVPHASVRMRCGAYGAMVIFVFAPFYLLGLVVCLNALASLLLMWFPRGTSERVPQLVAEYLVDRRLRRARAASVLWSLSFAAAWHVDAPIIALLFGVPAAVALLTFAVARGIRTELARGDARAELTNNVLILRGSRRRAGLLMGSSMIEEARRHAVPPSKAL